jgi:hypothetical protein
VVGRSVGRSVGPLVGRSVGRSSGPLHFSCPKHYLKTNVGNSIQLHTMIKHIERKCSVQEP